MRWLLAAIGTISLLTAACGGGGDNDQSPTDSTTSSSASTPSPSSTPALSGPSLRRDASTADIAFFKAGLLYLDEGMGGDLRRLTAGDECMQDPKWGSLTWSPDGAKLLCTSGDLKALIVDADGRLLGKTEGYIYNCAWSPDSINLLCQVGSDKAVLTLFDSNLKKIAEIPDSIPFGGVYRLDGLSFWSPDGDLFAYYSGENNEAIVASRSDPAQTIRLPDHRPLAWLDTSRLIVGQGTWDTDFTTTTRFETSTWNVDTDAVERLPGLDYDGAEGLRHQQAWLLPDATRALVIVPRNEYPLGLAVIDIDTGEITEITGSKIGYPSEGVPPRNIWLSNDGVHLWWAEVSTGTLLQRTALDNLEAQDMGHRNGYPMSVSGDARAIAFASALGSSTELVVENFDGSGRTVLSGDLNTPFTWRPEPQ